LKQTFGKDHVLIFMQTIIVSSKDPKIFQVSFKIMQVL